MTKPPDTVFIIIGFLFIAALEPELHNYTALGVYVFHLFKFNSGSISNFKWNAIFWLLD